MKDLIPLSLFASSLIFVACAHKPEQVPVGSIPNQTPKLSKVADFNAVQVTGVTASADGRVFANFPRWRDNLPFSVVEVLPDGSYKPYPDGQWNKWGGQPEKNHFTCVQSVVAHGDSLFVLDPASPMMKGVVGNAMLYEFDLKTNQLKRSWTFKKSVAPKGSYVNDLRVDDEHQTIYMTDSGLGGLVVLDLKTGEQRRVLKGHASTLSENLTLKVEGKEFLVGGRPARIHSDGIALSKDGYLYYHALTGRGLYRLPTKILADKKASDQKIAAAVEKVADTASPDGMIFDPKGNLYFGDLENNAILMRTPTGQTKVVLQDPQIKWADTFTIDRDNHLLFTASRLHEATPGKSVQDMTFSIFKLPLTE